MHLVWHFWCRIVSGNNHVIVTASDVLIDSLRDWGVDTIFGLPGDGINGIMEALRTRQDKIRFVQVRHEEAAAFMACAYAKYTGKLGVCLGTSGPGGIHLLNGLYDAKLDSQPVLAITGMHYPRSDRHAGPAGRGTRQTVPGCGRLQPAGDGVAHVENLVDLACRTAISYRGVAHITFPTDLQEQELSRKQESKRNLPHHTSDVCAHSARLPVGGRSAKGGGGVECRKEESPSWPARARLRAGEQLEAVAEKLGAPIIKALLGKAAVPDDSRYTTGGIGLLGTKPSQTALEECDTRVDRRQFVPLYRVYAEARQGARRPDRSRPAAYRPAISRGSRAWWAIAAVRWKNCCRCCSRKETATFLEKAQKGMAEWQATMRKQESAWTCR